MRSRWSCQPEPGLRDALRQRGELLVLEEMAKIAVVIERDADGFYAYVPLLRGCQSEGATYEEAVANVREATELYLETFDQ